MSSGRMKICATPFTVGPSLSAMASWSSSRVAVDRPAADERVLQAAGVPAPPLILAERQLVEPVALQGMLNVAGLTGLLDILQGFLEPIPLQDPCVGPGVAALELEALRQ